jgi:flagellar export protein FliJ
VKHRLDRVLRIRGLLEDVARFDLGKKNAEVRALEGDADRQRQLALVLRGEALEALESRMAGATMPWLMGIADAEIHAWKRDKLAGQALARKPGMDAARAEFFARRLDRRQVEMLVAGDVRAEEKERVRREQKQVDDWFQSRRGARQRRGKK